MTVVATQTLMVSPRPFPTLADAQLTAVRALEAIGDEVVKVAQENVEQTFERVGSGPDDLNSHFHAHVDPSGLSVEIENDAIHARMKELGGEIHASAGGWLTFQTYDGEWHRVASVEQKPMPYLEPAVDSVSQGFARDEVHKQLGIAL